MGEITWARAGCLSPPWPPPECPGSPWPPASGRTSPRSHTGDTPAPGHRRPGDNTSPGPPSRWWRHTPPRVDTPPCTACSQCAPGCRGHSPPPAHSCRPPPGTPRHWPWAVIMTLITRSQLNQCCVSSCNCYDCELLCFLTSDTHKRMRRCLSLILLLSCHNISNFRLVVCSFTKITNYRVCVCQKFVVIVWWVMYWHVLDREM